jgi:hypothetical protein
MLGAHSLQDRDVTYSFDRFDWHVFTFGAPKELEIFLPCIVWLFTPRCLDGRERFAVGVGVVVEE